MSTFGSPGGRQIVSKPSPPERGSFPLDHDAECQPIMKRYLKCLRTHRGVNDDECRELSKGYLLCRMERNLMAPDSMKNLGFQDANPAQQQQPNASASASADGEKSTVSTRTAGPQSR